MLYRSKLYVSLSYLKCIFALVPNPVPVSFLACVLSVVHGTRFPARCPRLLVMEAHETSS